MKTLERTLTPAEEAVRQREREAVRYRVSGKTLEATAVQVNVSVDAEGLRAQRWEEIKDTPVGQLLADPSAFADPAAVEGEFHEPGHTRAGVAVGANDTGGAGVDAGDQRAVGPDQPVGEGGAGSDQGDGGKAVDGLPPISLIA